MSDPSDSGRPRRSRARRGATLLAAVIGRFLAAVVLATVALALLVGALGLLNEPSTLSVLRAESETARFEVASPVQSSFRIAGLQIFGDGAWDGECAETAFGAAAAIEPQLGVEVVYATFARLDGSTTLVIELLAPDLESETAVIRGVDGSESVRDDLVLRTDASCASPAAGRLPIWGPGEIGGPPTFRADGPSPTLISGSLEMYGRAVTTGIDPIGWFASLLRDAPEGRAGAPERSDDRALYASLASAVEIPPGSRVSTLVDGADPALQALRGFARLDDGLLVVNVSTESPEVLFFPPGAAGDRPDRVTMSLLSQIGNDPNIQRAYQLLIFFAVALPIALELLKPLFFGRRNDD